MEAQQGFNFFQVLLIAAIPSIVTAIISYLVFRQQLTSFKRETMAERAARHYLKHKTNTDRSFATLKKHLGGYDNDEDELRRILLRAGAVRSFRTEANGTQTEWWTLLSRMPEKIKKKRKKNER